MEVYFLREIYIILLLLVQCGMFNLLHHTMNWRIVMLLYTL